jgi:DNA-binding PadR family transcriptional regulator
MRYLVLGLLRHGEHLHGYALWKAFEGRFGRRIQNGKFYRLLKNMAEGGWIRALARSAGDARRTSYEITPAGCAEFDDWLADVDELDPTADDPVSARVGFAFELAPAAGAAFFAAIENVLSARWKRLEHERDRVLARRHGDARAQAVQTLFLTRNLEHASTDLSWVREARAAYDRLTATPAPHIEVVPRRRTLARASR